MRFACASGSCYPCGSYVLQLQFLKHFAVLSAHCIHRALFSNCTINGEYKYAMRNGITVRCINVVSGLNEMVCVCVCSNAESCIHREGSSD